MNINTIQKVHKSFLAKDLCFYTDIFCDDILNDMAIDCASIELRATSEGWKLYYIRTQTGWFHFDQDEQETFLIDEYEKQMNHDELYMYIQLHGLQSDFMFFITQNIEKSSIIED